MRSYMHACLRTCSHTQLIDMWLELDNNSVSHMRSPMAPIMTLKSQIQGQSIFKALYIYLMKEPSWAKCYYI